MAVSSIGAFDPTLSLINSLNSINAVGSTQSVVQASALALSSISASFVTQISDVGQLISAVDSLQTAALALTQPQAFSALAATSSAPQVLSAAAAGVAPGSFSVQVSQLAGAQTLTSAVQASPSSPIGNGASSTVNFRFANGSGQSIALGSGDNTLAGIAAAINRAAIGVAASVQGAAGGVRLSLTGQSGAANAFTVSASGDPALAGLLSSLPGGGLALSASAQDAAGLLDGVAFSGGTNSVNTAVPGLSLQLQAVGNATVNVVPLASQIEGVQSLVKAFNQLQVVLQPFGQSAALFDPFLSTLQSALDNALGQDLAGLAAIGITRQPAGTLALDSGVFQSALNANPGALAQFFSNQGQGVADRLLALTEDGLAPQRLLDLAVSGINSGARLDQLLLGQSGFFGSSLENVNPLLFGASSATLSRLVSQFSLIQLL